MHTNNCAEHRKRHYHGGSDTCRVGKVHGERDPGHGPYDGIDDRE
jgi:hypothetical protein